MKYWSRFCFGHVYIIWNIDPEPIQGNVLYRPNSHPFNDRTLVLDQEVKVGRSVARAKPTITNAIFDCKVTRGTYILFIILKK